MFVIYQEPGVTGVVRDDGVFHVTAEGTLSAGHIERMGPKSLAYCEQHAPVRYLIESRGMNMDDLAARWKIAELMKKQRPYIDRTAVVGMTPAMKIIGRIVLKVAGRKNVKFFDSIEQAEAFLAVD